MVKANALFAGVADSKANNKDDSSSDSDEKPANKSVVT